MQRLLLRISLGLALTVLAISGPGAALAGTGADGSTYFLASYDSASLLGLNDQGRTITAVLDGATTFRSARLDKYIPNDPYKVACRSAASAYNDALVSTSDNLLDEALTSLAALGCKARVVFRPTDPYLPPNPILPGDPMNIVSFQPVP